MALTEVQVGVKIVVEGFEVTSPCADHDELRDELTECAYEIASRIGMELADIGTSSISGVVTLTVDGVSASSEDFDG